MAQTSIFDRNILNKITEIREWLGLYSRNSENTRERIEKEICVFFNSLGYETLEQVANFKVGDVSKFYSVSAEQGWSNNTTNSYITTAKLFYKWANTNEIIKPNNAVFTLKRIKNDAEPKYCPSKEQMEIILKTIKKHTKNTRLFLMIKLCIYTGLRRHEICNLKISDLMEDKIRVEGKGSKIRFQPVRPDIIKEIYEYIDSERKENMQKYIKMGRTDLGYVFVSGIGDIKSYSKKKKDLTSGNKVQDKAFYNQIKNICDKPEIEKGTKISTHTFRHFFGTTLYDTTNDLALTQEAMRHSDLSTTRRYVHLNEKRIQDALCNFSI